MFGLELYQVIFVGLFILLGIGTSLISFLRTVRVYLLASDKGKDFFLCSNDSFYDYLFRMFITVSIFWFLIAGVSYAIISVAIPEAAVLSIFIFFYVIIYFIDNKKGA